ncbi:HIT bis 5'-adenosyl triphosphatase [Encephalitozoon intestinalis ATCC 50506]|uniref:Bis(5'-adenosyl)-triphosphatase n=1 Tax=Encephalitozoon intestinalis (strain ATCC 50506) TaxID=876142 RepID=E0S9I3_ENCIT|nr:HIT bis 5'-adenosyl triphosphatase [Encephalitozoon intestinalis ATCC 50506]ADM12368.1 HIT bis 5'-adenosyl triphosphatase [Encephalitozoon intestinalis ATCC 50506]UTX46200.1 fragile histidine triad protein FHIT [Encephalitozoon intestinalis]
MEFGDKVIPYDHVIIKTMHSFIFTNLRPFLPLHILVSPISKKQRIYELTNEETSDLFNTVRVAMLGLKDLCDGFTLGVQDGSCAGQTVFHVHVHIVPRVVKDLERNDDIYEKGALDSADRPAREYDEMKKEAAKLRKIIGRAFDSEGLYYQNSFE